MQKANHILWIYSIASAVVVVIITAFLIGNNNIIVEWLREINLSIRDIRTAHFSSFSTSIDDFLQFVPAALFLILTLCGYKGKLRTKRFFTFVFIAVAIIQLLVYMLKLSASELRPDSTDTLSFPSGHTTTAFMIATMLSVQYYKRSIWFSIFGYACAIAVGCMRILNNRHWIMDVLTGAAIGIIITYWVYYITSRFFSNRLSHNNK